MRQAVRPTADCQCTLCTCRSDRGENLCPPEDRQIAVDHPIQSKRGLGPSPCPRSVYIFLLQNLKGSPGQPQHIGRLQPPGISAIVPWLICPCCPAIWESCSIISEKPVEEEEEES